MSHSYLSISKPGSSLYKVKGSKHYGYAFEAKDEAHINEMLDKLRAEHHNANHVCYAWRLGVESMHHRANDDGEPSNSAGMPILGQIEKHELSQVLVAVVRYFGGTKLGVGGLIDAYRTAASMAIEDAKIERRQLRAHVRIHFQYERMSDVMLAIRSYDWQDSDHDFRESCSLLLTLLPEKVDELYTAFAPFNDIRIEQLGIN